jgi:hypothetical protein
MEGQHNKITPGATARKGETTIETRVTAFEEAYCAKLTEFAPGKDMLPGVNDNSCGLNKEILDNIEIEPSGYYFSVTQTNERSGLSIRVRTSRF